MFWCLYIVFGVLSLKWNLCLFCFLLGIFFIEEEWGKLLVFCGLGVELFDEVECSVVELKLMSVKDWFV